MWGANMPTNSELPGENVPSEVKYPHWTSISLTHLKGGEIRGYVIARERPITHYELLIFGRVVSKGKTAEEVWGEYRRQLLLPGWEDDLLAHSLGIHLGAQDSGARTPLPVREVGEVEEARREYQGMFFSKFTVGGGK